MHVPSDNISVLTPKKLHKCKQTLYSIQTREFCSYSFNLFCIKAQILFQTHANVKHEKTFKSKSKVSESV